jgi:hypothetical protein
MGLVILFSFPSPTKLQVFYEANIDILQYLLPFDGEQWFEK